MRKGIFVVLFMLSFVLPAVASAGIVITEIMYDPEGSDSKQEWIELYNAGPDAVNLAEWTYADKSNHTLNTPPKNGGLGTMHIAPGRYVILASDAATFVAAHPGVSIVIDTSMSLNNSGMTIGLRKGTTPMAVATYDKRMGASGSGNSLQWNGTAWIHAAPTPGHENASEAAPEVASAQPTVSGDPQIGQSNDPLAIVNASAGVARAQSAAAASLPRALLTSYWWFAAVGFAIATGFAAAFISRAQKLEWDIEEGN